jgi:cytochrome c oxidase subunit 4
MSDTTETRPWAIWRPKLIVWAALLALLILTFVLAYVPLGPMQTAVALGIAAAKAAIVALLFMELRESSPLLRLAAAAGLVWLTIMFVLAFSDYLTRAS